MRPSVINFLLTGSLILMFAVNYGASMMCYECNSKNSCTNPGNCTTSGVDYCWKSETLDGHEIKKGCGYPVIGPPGQESTCKAVSYENVRTTFCTCTKHLCNNANYEIGNKVLAFSAVFVISLLQFI